MNYKMSQKLNKLIKLDIFLTRQFHIATKNFLSEYRVYFKAVEISGNGIIWLSLWIAFTWMFDNPHLVQMQVNMLLGLVIDIIATAVVKAYVQRRGPMAKPKDLLDPMSNEVFSFPSGHISCHASHGIPWLAFWIAFSWLFNNPHLVQMQVNILLGLIIDIIAIAIIKAYVRRRRPVANVDDSLGQMGPDIFSFPSGHVSRAVFVVYFFLRLWPVHFIFHLPLVAWAIAIGISRVLLSRHYLGNVLGGVVLGLFEGLLMELLWVEEGTAKWLFNALSDEKLDGGEYHV